MTGTSIRIFLADGTPEGLRVVSKSHWTGVALVSSRTRYLDARKQRAEYRSPGVYVLVGQAETPGGDDRIYVGESEDPRQRIDSHAGLDFWTRVVVFTSKDGSLNRASIKYLEARLVQLASKAGRAELVNGNAPTPPRLTEADKVDAEAFFEDMLMIYPLVGVRAFEPIEEFAAARKLYLSGPSAKAEGAQTEEGFVVFAGALARATPVGSVPLWAEAQRKALISAGTLKAVEGSDSLELIRDHEFASPTAAAAVMLGRSVAGPLWWKGSNGKTLKELTDEKIGESDASD